MYLYSKVANESEYGQDSFEIRLMLHNTRIDHFAFGLALENGALADALAVNVVE